MGRSVAGNIAATGEPRLLDDLSATTEVVRPLFRERVRSLLGASLRVKREVVGVVHVGAHTVHHFTREDLHLLVRVAEGVSSALERARLYSLLDATVTAIPNGVMVYSPSGQVLRMNPAAESILAYLLSNALKYSPSGSDVEVGVSQRGQAIVVEVTDWGPGMSERWVVRQWLSLSKNCI